MRILFIRHGKPDYKTDSLLEIGKVQADAVAARVKGEGISEIYSSTMGRAVQTAEPTSKLLGLDVTSFDFMREINWGNTNGEELLFDGHPWFTIPNMIKNGESVLYEDWYNREPFKRNDKLLKSVKRVTDGADAWLKTLGFEREGEYYRVKEENNKTIAMFSHGGSSTVFLSHIMNIPFPRMCSVFRPYFTSVTVVEFSGKVGELCSPKFRLMSDERHVPRDDDTGLIDN